MDPDQAKEVSNFLQTRKMCFTTDRFVDALVQLVEQDCSGKVEFWMKLSSGLRKMLGSGRDGATTSDTSALY